MTSWCERGNEFLDFMQGRKYLDQLSDCQLQEGLYLVLLCKINFFCYCDVL